MNHDCPDMDDTNRLGSLVRRLRDESKVSQARLAGLAEVDPKTVHRMERGVGDAREYATLRKIARGLALAFDDRDREEGIYAELTAAAGMAPAVVIRDDDNAEWAMAVDEYLRTDLGSDTAPDIAAQLRAVPHKAFQLRPEVRRDIHRARELLEVQAREHAASKETEDAQGFGLGRARKR